MKKSFIFLLLVLIAIFLSGLFGIVHDQISYTVSPEYFTKFKFQQFGLSELPLPDRVRASMVGFLASWWMGIPIGLLVGAVGFIHQGHWRMFKISLLSFVLVVAFTLVFGLCGLLYGWFQTRTINLAEYRDLWFIPNNIVNLRRFLCVGYMHNSSYLGGALAILVAWVFHFLIKIKPENKFS